MPVVKFPDGSEKEFNDGVSLYEISKSISNSLTNNAVAARVNGSLKDLSVQIDKDCSVQIVTKHEDAGLETIRHSFAHLVGHAVKQLYPDAQMAIGPTIKDGFYYDIDMPESIGESDLVKIESKVRELVRQNYDVVREVVTADKARSVFEARRETYKIEIVDEIADDEIIALYHHQEYTDMCRGPHVPNTKFLRHFKLTKLAGAYWRGDSENKMLQRIYGTAWNSREELDAYLERIAEAEKRDHRKLGKQLGLFHFQEEAPGMVFWHERGWSLFREVENYIREVCYFGYQEVHTPQVLDRSLWEKSGHWDKFREMIFETKSENREYAVKPMNCPGHVQIFNNELHSYKDLPIKIAEFGVVHRNEASGTLHGLLRARRFTQDDAHIFCEESGLQREVSELIDLTFKVYKDFGFENILVALSLRPEKRVGSDELWQKSEDSLKLALDSKKLDYLIQPGEGAFYGPKIEFSLKDSLERVWQCGTIQVDFSMPERLGASFVNSESQKQTPVMIHRAIVGSMERFIGIIIEEYAGKMPVWLAPVQVVVCGVTSKHDQYVEEVGESIKKSGIKVSIDLRNEKIGFKIRHHTLQKVPYLLVVGDREAEDRSVSVRRRGISDVETMSLGEFQKMVTGMIESRSVN